MQKLFYKWLILVVALGTVLITNAQITPADHAELLRIYNGMSADLKTKYSNWTTPGQSSYTGITLDASGNIEIISINAVDLTDKTFTLPSNLTLPKLRNLGIYYAETTTIPSLSSSPELTSLTIHGTKLSGIAVNTGILYIDFRYLSDVPSNLDLAAIFPNLIFIWLETTVIGGDFPYFPNLVGSRVLGNYFNYYSFEWLKAVDMDYYNKIVNATDFTYMIASQKVKITEPQTGVLQVVDFGGNVADFNFTWSNLHTGESITKDGNNTFNPSLEFTNSNTQEGNTISLSIAPKDRSNTPVPAIYGFSAIFKLDSELGLPVVFTNVAANINKGLLTVSWTTQTESNNDYFDIEVSADGKTFKKLQTIQSKATNGISTIPIDYEYSIGTNALGTLLALPALLGLLVLSVSPSSKRKYWVLKSTLAIIAISAIGFACSKKDSTVNMTATQKTFVRIAQVDKSGHTLYSKVVQAVNK